MRELGNGALSQVDFFFLGGKSSWVIADGVSDVSQLVYYEQYRTAKGSEVGTALSGVKPIYIVDDGESITFSKKGHAIDNSQYERSDFGRSTVPSMPISSIWPTLEEYRSQPVLDRHNTMAESLVRTWCDKNQVIILDEVEYCASGESYPDSDYKQFIYFGYYSVGYSTPPCRLPVRMQYAYKELHITVGTWENPNIRYDTQFTYSVKEFKMVGPIAAPTGEVDFNDSASSYDGVALWLNPIQTITDFTVRVPKSAISTDGRRITCSTVVYTARSTFEHMRSLGFYNGSNQGALSFLGSTTPFEFSASIVNEAKAYQNLMDTYNDECTEIEHPDTHKWLLDLTFGEIKELIKKKPRTGFLVFGSEERESDVVEYGGYDWEMSTPVYPSYESYPLKPSAWTFNYGRDNKPDEIVYALYSNAEEPRYRPVPRGSAYWVYCYKYCAKGSSGPEHPAIYWANDPNLLDFSMWTEMLTYDGRLNEASRSSLIDFSFNAWDGMGPEEKVVSYLLTLDAKKHIPLFVPYFQTLDSTDKS